MLLTHCIAAEHFSVTGFGIIYTDGGETSLLSDPLISPLLWSWTSDSVNGPSLDFVPELTKVSNSS